MPIAPRKEKTRKGVKRAHSKIHLEWVSKMRSEGKGVPRRWQQRAAVIIDT
jgi:hypothetical protein